jgi:hypothetical protein
LLAFQVPVDVEITDHILEGGPLLTVHSQTVVSADDAWTVVLIWITWRPPGRLE